MSSDEQDDEVMDTYALDEEDMAEDDGNAGWRPAPIPNTLSGLRACIPCLLVKTHQQFYEDGCENCEQALELSGNESTILDVTTENFEGLIALTKPEESWVAKWQFITEFMPGIYAIHVKGSISEENAAKLKGACGETPVGDGVATDACGGRLKLEERGAALARRKVFGVSGRFRLMWGLAGCTHVPPQASLMWADCPSARSRCKSPAHATRKKPRRTCCCCPAPQSRIAQSPARLGPSHRF
jgi:transcription elongation factor SPT4